MASSSTYGDSCTFSILANCTTPPTDNLSYYIFWTNNTGTWTADAPVIFTNAMYKNASSAWANVTKTLTNHITLSGVDVIQYQFDINDTLGNWMNSTTASVTLSGQLQTNWNLFLTQMYVVVGLIGLVPLVLIMAALMAFHFDSKTMLALIFAMIIIIVCVLIILTFLSGIASSST